MTQAASEHLGESLGTDFFSVREQFTDEQWSHYCRGLRHSAPDLRKRLLGLGKRPMWRRRLTSAFIACGHSPPDFHLTFVAVVCPGLPQTGEGPAGPGPMTLPRSSPAGRHSHWI